MIRLIWNQRVAHKDQQSRLFFRVSSGSCRAELRRQLLPQLVRPFASPPLDSSYRIGRDLPGAREGKNEKNWQKQKQANEPATPFFFANNLEIIIKKNVLTKDSRIAGTRNLAGTSSTALSTKPASRNRPMHQSWSTSRALGGCQASRQARKAEAASERNAATQQHLAFAP